MPIADGDEAPVVPKAPETPSPAAGWKPSQPAKPEDDVQKTMDDARRKLAEIDALLGKTIQ
jgi:chemotaxis protein MotC